MAAVSPLLGSADAPRALYDKAHARYDAAMGHLAAATEILASEPQLSTKLVEYTKAMNLAGEEFRKCGAQ